MDDNIVWKLIQAYYDSNNFLSHQIDTFNDFVTYGIQQVVSNEPAIEIAESNYRLKFGDVTVLRPGVSEEDLSEHTIYPNDCRHRDLNYAGTICCDIEEVINGVAKITNRVAIGKLPIMVKSAKCNLTGLSEDEQMQYGECCNDWGGYFIIKGHERVIVAQLRGNYNNVLVHKMKIGHKYKYIAEARSMSNETGHSVLIQGMIESNNRNIILQIHYVKEPIPAVILFKALGYTDEKDIISLIGLDDDKSLRLIRFMLRDAHHCQTQDEALQYIGQYAVHIIDEEKRIAYARQVVETELLPHLGVTSTNKEKAVFIGYLLRKLIMTNNKIRPPDDRDNYSNKRVEATGTLMHDIFRNLFKKFTNVIKAQLEKRRNIPDIRTVIAKNQVITKGINQCLATGNWVAQKNASAYARPGVSQILDRMTYASSLSHLRRVIMPSGNEGKNVAMQQINPSSWGFICPCETPEGKKVGTVLNLAVTAKISRKTPVVDVRRILEEDCKSIIGIQKVDLKSSKDYTLVMLNSVIIGFAEDPEKTVDEVKLYRTIGLLNEEVSVTYDMIDNVIYVYCDEGRVIRPLIRVDEKNNISRVLLNNSVNKFNWDKLMRKKIVQFADSSEIENNVVAMYPEVLQSQKCTLCEIHPCTMLGIMAACIPFPDHSQSPRNCYQSSMGKQALGIPLTSYKIRTDTLLHVLENPQKPIVTTKMSDILGISEIPSGVNAIVAIATYGGSNQEDSVLLNKASVERGLFHLTTYRTISTIEKRRDTYSYEQICLPPKNSDSTVKPGSADYFRRKHANYGLLDEKGIIRPRENGTTGRATYINKGDVIIGKISVSGTKGGEEGKVDVSVVAQSGEEGYVDHIFTDTTPNGYTIVKIVIRENRKPYLGDKLASRAAQKGTIGMVIPQEDMPFSADGIVPDIIMNPNAIPSRMTTNQLIESNLAKGCCLKGKYGDATPFTKSSTGIAEECCETLLECGMEPHGWEMLCNGMTGEMMHAKIYMGVVYYQRLKHMVDDKVHARARGKITQLTRQSSDGKLLESTGKLQIEINLKTNFQ